MSNIGLIRNDDPEYVVKCIEYQNYVLEHMENVKRAYRTFFKNDNLCGMILLPKVYHFNLSKYSKDEVDFAIASVEEEILKHDISKLSDDEFPQYRIHFYPTNKEKVEIKEDDDVARIIDEEFNIACIHHYCNNPHHPKFWRYNRIDKIDSNGVPTEYHKLENPGDPTDMSLQAIIHMICDWEAMSMKFNNDCLEWYMSDNAEEERNDLSYNTRVTVEEILHIIHEYK